MTTGSGSCICGAVKISFDDEPMIQGLCHCGNCKKITASAFSTNAVVSESKFKVDGEVKTYTINTTGSGMPATLHFCPTCSCVLWAVSGSNPGYVTIKTGVLDEGGLDAFAPGAEVWVSKRATWYAGVGGECAAFQKMPPGFPGVTDENV
ncbi:hypothetical protein NA57DRAFT_61153 [Rhizodiscina lignyota]|uniref:CENP-V/GFA domain-containing protein n=1 Tax=Rhizodiscina lignyota TaxID=1504668 RepID=A0A9P4I6P3_9PEZI|nr:hypothetical protein NA57DRAFT_61153 [Rhizodiscina lignyota]